LRINLGSPKIDPRTLRIDPICLGRLFYGFQYAI